MPAPPFAKILALLNVVLATLGLLAVAALTTPAPAEGVRLALGILLAVIWAAYALQLAGHLLLRTGLKDAVPALVVDLSAVIVPLAGFLLANQRDRYLYCCNCSPPRVFAVRI